MLNKSVGNMYDFVTHTWNTVKGECYHNCLYCYMKRFGNQKPARFDEKELKTDLGKDNFIFVGSSCDMFAKTIPDEWIKKTLQHCSKFGNRYLFQTKNPERLPKILPLPYESNICVTMETNRFYPNIMNNSPKPLHRYSELYKICTSLYITIEPVMDFDLNEFVNLLKHSNAIQINIGADSGNNNLPEPPKEKILQLIYELSKFTQVNQKSNLKRLLK